MVGYWSMKFISWLVCIAPKCLNKLVAAGLGKLAWLATPTWRKVMAVENIKECLGLPEQRAQAIAKESVERFGRMIVEVLSYPKINLANLPTYVQVEGLAYLDAAYKQNKGVLLCTGHYGNWEMLGTVVALLGYPLLSIARKQNNQGMDAFINEYRAMTGQKITYNHGENNMLAINRIVRDKKILGVIYDQDTGHDGIHTTLFGKPAVVPPGAAILSRIHGAPMLPIFIHNQPDGTLVAKIYPPVYTAKTKDKTADIRQAMDELIVICEQEIVNDPAMWFWVHDRWKDGREKYKKTLEGGQH
ncbi:MAG: lysophospholipid acyltransferase family protein [Acidaminococcaceae bacterium]